MGSVKATQSNFNQYLVPLNSKQLKKPKIGKNLDDQSVLFEVVKENINVFSRSNLNTIKHHDLKSKSRKYLNIAYG
jgi:hypothetical protein